MELILTFAVAALAVTVLVLALGLRDVTRDNSRLIRHLEEMVDANDAIAKQIEAIRDRLDESDSGDWIYSDSDEDEFEREETP